MGTAASTQQTGLQASKMSPRKIDKLIDNEIAAEEKRRKSLMKILCLGTSNSGKSTILKQMRILHLDGFSKEEKNAYRDSMLLSFWNSVNDLLQKLPDGKVDNLKKRVSMIVSSTIQQMKAEAAFLLKISAFFESPTGKQLLKRHGKGEQCINYICYFLNRIKDVREFSSIDPTAEDILRVRIPTTGVAFTHFNYKKANFCMIDVGGQRSERRKWIHLFDDVRAVFFVVDISNFSGLAESLMVFSSICSTKSLQYASIILFFNKVDLFEERDDRHELSRYFPSFRETGDYTEAGLFLKELFEEKRKGMCSQIYSFFTCATDTRNIDRTFGACSDIILKRSLTDAGLF